mgnify:CR=1 FL=1
MDKKLVVANIGMKFGMCHVEGAMSFGAEIGAICDSNEENLRFAGERYNIPEEKRFTDYADIINNDAIDVVTVAIPDQQHVRVSCDLLRAGKHVLCEKPMALNSAQCEEMLAVAKETGKELMIGQCLRFSDAYRYVKKCIDENTFGELKNLNMYRLSAHPEWGFENWFQDDTRSGGCILDMHIHDIDMARYLLGEPEAVSVTAFNGQTRWQVENTRLFYPNLTVVADGSWNEGRKSPFSAGLRARFEKAQVVMQGYAVKVYPNEGDPFVPDIPVCRPFTEEFAFFIDLLLNNKENLENPAESAYKTVKLVELLRESADNGAATVSVNY